MSTKKPTRVGKSGYLIEHDGHKSKAHRDQAKQCRSVANQLAVNCRSQIGRIEGTAHWKKDQVLVHFHEAFTTALTLLSKPAPTPWVRPPHFDLTEDNTAEPVEAPPSVTVSPMDGSAGSGEGKTDRGVSGAPPTPNAPSWDEVLGLK